MTSFAPVIPVHTRPPTKREVGSSSWLSKLVNEGCDVYGVSAHPSKDASSLERLGDDQTGRQKSKNDDELHFD